MQDKLWYKEPPNFWDEGLPIGNGRLAAMVWGDEEKDVLTLNNEWLWRGVNRNRDNEYCADMLQEIRNLLKKKDYFKATALANAFMGGKGGVSGITGRVDAYQPAGELEFKINSLKKYKCRSLDVIHGIAECDRSTDDGEVHSSFMAHLGYNNIICHWSGVFSGELRYSRAEDKGANGKLYVEKDKIEFECKFDGGIEFKTCVRIKTDGITEVDGTGLIIRNATELTAYVNIATEVKGIDEELKMYPAPHEVSFEEIVSSQEKLFSDMMSNFDLQIEAEESCLSTSERIQAVKNGENDILLPLLYFNYSRYLLISCSACGDLPANLQGKWNNLICPPWECDYHFDINLQMNYWAAEELNLSNCVEALLKYAESFMEHGRKAARDLYGCRGIYLPIQTDAWGRSTPESYGWAAWIGAAPWIAQHFWKHYLYTGNIEFLKDRAYPFFKEVALFYEDYLVEDDNGVMQIMPSQSPENRFEGTGCFPVSIGISSAMDVQLAYDAFGYAIKSAEILGIDRKCAAKWSRLQGKLPEFKIGNDGRLLEWDEEKVEIEPGHRHISHLYGLYPGDIFNEYSRTNQYKAAIKSFNCRMAQGGGHTGWSRAWSACICAKIGDKDSFWLHINEMIREFATVSLLDLHPPRIFQIDGNLGASAAIVESISQYWGGKLHLLRALPKAWNTGKIKGYRVPGGHSVNFVWIDGKAEQIEITIGFENHLIVSYNGKDYLASGTPGEKVVLKF